MLLPEQYPSQWPSSPHPQVMKPCGSTVMWPTSPALPSHPESTLPSTATPAPIPEEMVRYTMSSGLRSEWNRSPMTPAMVSLWRWTSSVSNSCETGPMRGIRSTVSGRFAGPCTIPAARSRGPIEPIPAATTAVGSIPASSHAPRTTPRTASVTAIPFGPLGVPRESDPRTVAVSSPTTARTFVAPRSTPT